MIRIRRYIENPEIYGVYIAKENIYAISTNPDAKHGCVYVFFGEMENSNSVTQKRRKYE